MWTLVDRYTGHVRYRGGIKATGLDANPPVIDCSGWVAFLLASGMKAANSLATGAIFSSDDIVAIDTWSDHMIEVLRRQSGWMLEGGEIMADALPAFATIGLQQGGGAWATNHPRPAASPTSCNSFNVLVTGRDLSLKRKGGLSRMVCACCRLKTGLMQPKPTSSLVRCGP
jgi:hypothetical protein